MAWELIADYRQALGATEDDNRWTALAIGFSKGLLIEEPRLRFRIRNLPQGISKVSENKAVGEQGKSTMIEQPVALDSENVPAVLRQRLEVPRRSEFWLRNYHCQECVDPSKGTTGLYVPHIRRKLHMKGQPLVYPPKGSIGDDGIKPVHKTDPHKGDVFMKGIRSTWQPTRQAMIGTPARLAANRTMTMLRYTVAITSMPDDPAQLAGYHYILLVPLKKVADPQAEAKRLKAVLPEAENVAFLPANPKEGIKAILATFMELDSDALDKPDELEDVADLVLKVQEARAAFLVDPKSPASLEALSTSLTDLVAGVPERTRDEARSAAAALAVEDPAQAIKTLDAALSRLSSMLDPELQEQIARDAAAQKAMANIAASKGFGAQAQQAQSQLPEKPSTT